MAKKYSIEDTTLQGIADAIRSKTGGSDSITVADMAEEIGGITTGGEQVAPTITLNSSTGLITATAGTKSSTYQLAFQAAQTITPGTTNKTIAANTYLGGVQTIKGDANLVAGNIKNGTSIFGVTGTYAGSGGGDTSMEDGIIDKTLRSYINNKVRSIGAYAFYSCSNLTTVSFPAATTIGEAAFRNCSNLTTVSFPAATTISNMAFYWCYNLTTASFPAATTISNYAFRSCSNLTTIYLKSTTICTLLNSNAFSDTGITSTTGSIFVLASLVSLYKKSTNWVYFSRRIFSYAF